MPAISTGRNAGSARGRSAGRHKRKRDVEIQHRQTQRQTATALKAAAPANRKAQKEKERKDVLKKAAPSRQLGERGSRGHEPQPKARDAKKIRNTVAGPRGMTIERSGESTGQALKRLIDKADTRKDKSKELSPLETAATAGFPAAALANLIGGTPRKIVKNTFKDAYQAPAQVVPSMVQNFVAVNEARKGNLKPIKEMAKQIDASDPVWNAVMAGANLATGDIKNAKKRAIVAKDSAIEHPGLTALEVYGTKGAAGRLFTRGANATARAARGTERVTKGKVGGKTAERARRAGSTERAKAVLPGTNLAEHRTYSKDAIDRYFQKRHDRNRSKAAAEIRSKAKQADDAGDVEQALELRERANRADPEILTDKNIRRAVDEHVDASEQVRRKNRGAVESATRKLLGLSGVKRGTKRGGPITSLVTQRITTAELPDLIAYRDRLISERAKIPKDEPARIAANKKLERDLTEAIENVRKGKVDLDNLKRIADTYAERSEAGQQELIKRGLVEPEQAARRAAAPHAAVNMDVGKEKKLLKDQAKADKKASNKATARLASEQRKLSRLKARQQQQRVTAPEAQLKFQATRTTSKRRKQRVEETGTGAYDPLARARSLTEYMKLVEEMSPEELAKAVAAENKRVKKAAKQSKRVETAEAIATAAGAKARKSKRKAAKNPLVRRGTGEDVSTEQMLADMEAKHGTRTAAYVSAAPGKTKASAYYQPGVEAVSAKTGKYGGRSAREGSFEGDPDALVTQAVRTQGLIDASDSFQRLISRFALNRKKGDGEETHTEKTWQKAADVARQKSTEGQVWVPVRLKPLGSTQSELDAFLTGTSNKGVLQAIGNAAEPGEGGPWAVVPKEVADQLNKHMAKLNPGNTMRAWQQMTNVFRRTVLATSPTWFLGNVGEGAFRSALNLVGPRDYVTGKKIKKAVRAQAKDQTQADIAEARTTGTGHYGFAQRQQVHRDLTQYSEGSVKKLGRIVAAVRDAEIKGTPISPKLAVSAWDRLTNFTMTQVNKRIEDQIQTAMLGKAVRNQRTSAGKRQVAARPQILMTNRAKELSRKAAEDAANGVLDENTAAALGREIDRMYGKYSKFSPDKRAAIALYTPFAAWTLNALRFVGRLPHDHPAFTAATAAVEMASEEWRKEHGLDMFMGEGAVPDWLQGSIPDEKGGHYRAPTRYTPLSIGVDTPGVLAAAFLPQISSVLNALGGDDWKGDPIRHEDGTEITGPEKFVEAGKALALGTVPLAGQIARADKKGEGDIKAGLAALFGLKALAQYSPPSEPKGGGGGGDPWTSDDWSDGGSSSDNWGAQGWDEDGTDWESDSDW